MATQPTLQMQFEFPVLEKRQLVSSDGYILVSSDSYVLCIVESERFVLGQFGWTMV